MSPASSRGGRDSVPTREAVAGRVGRPTLCPMHYLTAAILSRIPGVQDFASSDARYTFCAYARKALTSGAYTSSPCFLNSSTSSASRF